MAQAGSRGRRGSPATLLVESVLLATFTAGWEITGAKPEGGAQLLLLTAAAVAMGMQSGVVAVMGIAGVSTTYLTGTLTTLIDALASPRAAAGQATRAAPPPCARWSAARRSAVCSCATVPAAVPAVPLVTLAGAIITGTRLAAPRRAGRQLENRGPGNGEWSRSPHEQVTSDELRRDVAARRGSGAEAERSARPGNHP